MTSPVDTGYMRSSHVVQIVRRGRTFIGTITVLADYGLPVHDGWNRTAPILPVRKKALRFKVHGATVIVAAVNTPASYAGRPWLREALFAVAVPRGFIVTPY